MGKIKDYVAIIKVKTRERLNPYFAGFRRKQLKNKGFTIISNNCWGGHVYRFFAMPYDSPTIGLYFFSADYIKFVSNLRYYIEQDLTFIDYTESKYKDELLKNNQLNVPIGKLHDVEIVFLHYHSIEEAQTKWNRRKERIHWDNLYYKMSEQNCCTKEHLEYFDSLDNPNKFVFVTKDYGLKTQVIFKDCAGMDYIPNDTTNFRKFINIINWLNGKPFKLKQS